MTFTPSPSRRRRVPVRGVSRARRQSKETASTHVYILLLRDDLLQRLLPDVALDLPRGEHMALRKHVLDLLQRAPRGLGEAEENMDERRKVERPEDEVRLVGDGGEAWWDGPGEGKVEQPTKHSLSAKVNRAQASWHTSW